ncbi:DUF3802 family protein [Photobacterium leiognathi]|uniref:DUF3802 family protein n=1 Tax=Photobacterium leiognathi TaxID=553611 RepID=UPI002982783E|nr:DUF3802 family protein [Photobacterium leiognathi]
MENSVKNLVAHTEGYEALIEYLASNLTLFEGASASDQGVTIEEVVTDLIATQLMAVFSQNPDIEQDIRFQLMQEADSVMADLHQVLEGVWLREPTNEQINFLEDFISLVKNLFDSAIAKLS